ncbi:MAG: hypothetical protein EOP13_01105 [Pseudomonas sp.]|nr:MAG: hypothetical protein EOP13_01105 [Pseudomonas sp.]
MSLDDARVKCKAWRINYSVVRPHSSLDNLTRMERAKRSRLFPHRPDRRRGEGQL